MHELGSVVRVAHCYDSYLSSIPGPVCLFFKKFSLVKVTGIDEKYEKNTRCLNSSFYVNSACEQIRKALENCSHRLPAEGYTQVQIFAESETAETR